jgi:hypothetical protein
MVAPPLYTADRWGDSDATGVAGGVVGGFSGGNDSTLGGFSPSPFTSYKRDIAGTNFHG